MKYFEFSIMPVCRYILLMPLIFSYQSNAQPELTRNLSEVQWIHGASDCDAARQETGYMEWQKIYYQPDTVIFRQNKCANYEAPFVYLFTGTEKALLIDTGATVDGGPDLLAAVREITVLPLIVAHSHGHGDHIQGDTAFADAENATVVEVGADVVQQFYGFRNWPMEQAKLELGNRTIMLLPIPGHTDDDLAYYDPVSQFVVTGDSLYPGRLYVRNWVGYRASIARLNTWLQDKTVSHVMGTHIEMTAEPDIDYPVGTTYQPDEHQLPLSVADVNVLNETLELLEAPEQTYLGSFIIWPID